MRRRSQAILSTSRNTLLDREVAAMRVLVVEDEGRLAETGRRGLSAEGFVVDVVHDGNEGLFNAQVNGYDVVVLDIMLPGLNGYEVCRRLRAAGVWSPVLMLTAKDGEYDQADALDLGADDYLTKPFSFLVLVARLRALIRRGAPVRPTLLAAGHPPLHAAPRPARPAGSPVTLPWARPAGPGAAGTRSGPSPRVSSACCTSSCVTAA